MKKLFLIPLMTLVCSVMAWGSEVVVNDFATLKTQLSASGTADVVKLGQDIAYPTNGSDLLNIERSLTLDGQGHKISGYGSRGGQPNVISINYNKSSYVTVELKNLDIYSTQYRPLETRGYITKLTLDNVNITSTGGSSNPQGLTIGGTQTSAPYGQLVIKDSKINVGNSGYPVIFWNPTEITLTNSDFSGYCALYFKDDSYGSSVYADACNFDAPNVHSGASNAFAVFALETTNLTFHLNNCGMNAEKYGDQSQDVFSLSEWTPLSRRNGDITILLSGDNSHFSTSSMFIGNTYYYAQVGGKWTLITNDNKDEFNFGGNLNVTFTGGTYSVNPYEMAYYRTFYWDEESLEADLGGVTILPTDTVQEVNQGGVTLYRVVKKAAKHEIDDPDNPGSTIEVLYNLNDNVQGVDSGNNPNTSFELSAGVEMKLDSATVTAGYVQVLDNEDTGDATVILVGKTEVNPSTSAEEKVDQVLVIGNGLDVQGESQVVVQSGSTLQIGEGGINTEKPENIVIEADESGAASLLLDPTITVNQTPNLTVEMKVSQAGKDAYGDYWWHRFAMPVGSLPEAWTKSPNYGTYLFGWNYAANSWEPVEGGSTSMVPWKGYTLTYNEPYDENETVTYTFKGNLLGNTDAALTFEEEGYQFFGNSYTGYIDVLTLINQLTDGNVDRTVWMWNPGNQTYSAVPLDKLETPEKADRLKSWQKEVAPMQTFIMRLRGATSANETVSYADAIWGNPRYGNGVSTPAPRRKVAAAISEDTYMEIVVTAANGQSDRVDFTVNSEHSDAFENGFDASKYMNERYINLYAPVAGENYTSVVTDNIEGKTLSLQTKNDITYTMSFENVNSDEYVIRDNVTGAVIAIEEGATYEFAAQPNSLIEGRFEIVAAAKAPTAIENTNVKTNAKGIYTIMGQYLGEDFKVLPAGVYVVNGVKIVK